MRQRIPVIRNSGAWLPALPLKSFQVPAEVINPQSNEELNAGSKWFNLARMVATRSLAKREWQSVSKGLSEHGKEQEGFNHTKALSSVPDPRKHL